MIASEVCLPVSTRKPYPSDVSDAEWAFVAPYLTLMTPAAPQRHHDLREVFNALRRIVRAGAPWRLLPNDFAPWEAVYQQTQRWLTAGSFEAMAHDLRVLLRLAAGRAPDPSAAIFDSRTLQSTPESGHRAGYDGAKRKRGSKVHQAVDTLGHLLALHVTPADAQDRAQVATLAAAVQAATGERVELAYGDQGYAGAQPAADAAAHGIQLEVVKLPAAKHGFVLLPRRWVVERTQPHNPTKTRSDRGPAACDDRNQWAPAPARDGRAGPQRPGCMSPGGGRAMSGQASHRVPPRPARDAGRVAGRTCRWHIASGCCGS